ncbi:MotA/TolQ/ExbB proton channel family protein [Caenispirillum bisanense]|uniref:MotA/TolQ/ExbB proton channel family protein n=1 Tax=Caenispirillum bisanense TaxID=414052 RepID=UPI0031DAACE9
MTDTVPAAAADPAAAVPPFAAEGPEAAATSSVAGAMPADAGPFADALGLLSAGGPIMYVLAALSVIAAAVIIVKLLQLAALRPWATGAVRRALHLWRTGRGRDALPALDKTRSPVAQVLRVALETRLDPNVSETAAREEAERVAGLHLDRLAGGLRLLAAIAALSPLLGLLGTVIGMIDAFQALENAGSRVDPSILSGGIWVALLTTAAGLVVAIPAAAAHQWLEGIVERTGRAMEDAATQVFTQQPATALRRAADTLPGRAPAAGAAE